MTVSGVGTIPASYEVRRDIVASTEDALSTILASVSDSSLVCVVRVLLILSAVIQGADILLDVLISVHHWNWSGRTPYKHGQ